MITTEQISRNVFTYDLVKFRNLLDVLASCNDRHRFRFTKEGLEIKTVDPANVYLICVRIPKEAFSEYPFTEDLEINFPVETVLGKLRTAYFRDVDLGESFSLSTEIIKAKSPLDEDQEVIHCKAGSFSFSVIASKNIRSDPKIPSISLPLEYEVSTEELYSAICLMDNAEQVIFDKTTLIQNTKNTDDESIIENIYELATANVIKNEGIGKSEFSTEFLEDLLKPLRDVSSVVTVSLGEDFPLVLTANTVSGEELKLLLAPRIHNN